MGFKINQAALKQFERKVDDAWAEVITALDLEYENVINDENAFPDFPNQDIVDTARFRDGQSVDVKARRALWLWAPISPDNGYCYAAALYYGFYAYGGSKWIEGRPWVEVAFQNVNPVAMMALLLAQKGIKARIVRQANNLRIG